MFDQSWSTLLAAALIVGLAYGVYGLTGFGAVIVGIPLLAHFFPLRFAVPLMLVFDLCVGLLLGLKARQLADWRELRRLIPWIVLGMLVGLTVLVKAPERWLVGLLGLFVLCMALWNLFRRRVLHPLSARWAVPAGGIGGAFTALYGTGGVIYVIYLARRLTDPGVLRATVGVLIFINAVVRLGLFAGTGLFDQAHLLPLALALLPCAAAGYFVGAHWHARVSPAQATRLIWMLLVLSGLSLLARSAA